MDKEEKYIINFYQINHKLIKEVYVKKPFGLLFFGITQNPVNYYNQKWSIVHIPSESEILSIFKTYNEAENFLKLLHSKLDLNCFLLCNPDRLEVYNEIRLNMQEILNR